MTPESIIKLCDDQISIGLSSPVITLRLPGKWKGSDKRRLCKGGPLGEIVCGNFDGLGIIVIFDALEVRDYLSSKLALNSQLKHPGGG